jgi:peptidoglycan/xylan/chitin deacetylase (PgdA/CDA1 family)
MTTARALRNRLSNKWRRFSIEHGARRNFKLAADRPVISFTFDDFPRSALVEGGAILARQGVRGTYFSSLDLLGRPSVSGPIASREDLRDLLRDGHELGCHTFEHLDGRHSSVEEFERSIQANRVALDQYVPGASFPVFAYPLEGPVLDIKRAVGRHFVGCRWGGQSFNSGTIDLNLLKAYFIDWKTRDHLQEVQAIIEQNASARGWLIFATHDVTENPSDYGCTPGCFDDVVRMSIDSGACVLPMMRACQKLNIVAKS